MTEYLDAQRSALIPCLFDAKSGSTRTIQKLTDEIGLVASHFDHYQLKTVFDVVQKRYIKSATGETGVTIPDILTDLEQYYRSNGRMDKAEQYVSDWRSKIAQMQKPQGDPFAAARQLINGAIVRQIRHDSPAFYEAVRTSQNPIDEVLDWSVYFNSLAVSNSGSASTATQIMDDIPTQPPTSCGIDWIDRHILYNCWYDAGGWTPQTLVAWLAPSSHGKSSVAATFTVRRAQLGYPTLFQTAEESIHIVTARLLCIAAQCPKRMAMLPKRTIEAVAKGEIPPSLKGMARDLTDEKMREHAEHILAAYTMLDKFVRIYKITSDNVSAIEKCTRRHRIEFGDLPMLLLIDHLGELDSVRTGNWSRDLAFVVKDIRRIVDKPELLTCGLVFSQVTKEMECELTEKNYTTLRDARGSRAVLNKSDILVVSSRHNGKLKDAVGRWYGPVKGYEHATSIQARKNRFSGESSHYSLGVLDFDPAHACLTDRLISTDMPSDLPPLEESETAPLNF